VGDSIAHFFCWAAFETNFNVNFLSARAIPFYLLHFSTVPMRFSSSEEFDVLTSATGDFPPVGLTVRNWDRKVTAAPSVINSGS
jgi:hypothetical protein